MANATENIVLLLTQDEAQTLAEILSLVGGDPDTTQRGLADNVREALESVGFHFSPYNSPQKRAMNGKITFS